MDESIQVRWVDPERLITHKNEKRTEKEKRKIQRMGCLLDEALTRHQAVDGHIGGGRVCPCDLSASGQSL